MNKDVILTWDNTNKQRIVEQVILLDEDELSETEDTTVHAVAREMMIEGLVVFEDDNGIFGLPADQIVKIEDIEN